MTAHELRRQLLTNGYEPIPVDGKAPHWKDWNKGAITAARLSQIEAAYPDHTNTGLRTGRLVGVDTDLTNAAHVIEIEKVIADVLGESLLRRVGAKGVLLCYRNDAPIPKITIGTKDKRLVEILGAGQHFVAYGTHPATGKEYKWTEDWLGGDPLQMPLAKLPQVTPEQLHDVSHAVAAKLKALGYGDVAVTGIKAEREATAPAASGAPVSPAQIEAMLRRIPPSIDRNGWLTVCGALVVAPIDDLAWDGLETFIRWSRGDLHDAITPANFKGAEDCEAQWARDIDLHAHGKDVPAFGALVNLARAHGFEGRSDNRPASEVFKDYLSAQAVTASPPRKKFDPIFARDFPALPKPSYVVDQTVPPGITAFYGPSGSFKSFLALDIGASAAAGIPAFNKFVTVQGDAIMAAGEAPFGIAQGRFPAWALARGVDPGKLPFAIMPSVPLVSDGKDIEAFIGAVKGAALHPRIVIFDTVARAMGGLDENEARAAGLMIAAAEHVIAELGCAVILVAHSGKDESKGIRGSSALFAGVDAVFNVARTKDSLAVRLICEKMKDADAPADIHLQGQAIAGSLVFSAITADEYAASTRTNPPLSQAEVVRALRAAGAINGTEISTNALAVTLAAETASDPKAIAALEKRLRRGAEGQLAAYVAGGMGKGSRLRWTFPTLEKQGSEHV